MVKIVLNDDAEVVAEIRKGLAENKRLYNYPYCPCRLEHIPDNICMCKEFREQKEGLCHCGLYRKIVVEEEKK